MALKPHPTDPDKAVFVKNEYDFGPRWKDITNAELVEELRRRKILETVFPKDEWQNLTDKQLLEAYGWMPAPGAPDWILEGAKEELLGALRKVELKIREKNNG